MSRFGLVEEADIEMMIESSKKGMHKTMEGSMVKIGTKECQDDLIRRMGDMSYHRDDHDYGSDARSYFSGILKVLRRKLRENDKILGQNEVMMTEEDFVEEMPAKDKKTMKESIERKTDEETANRILKLAGLI